MHLAATAAAQSRGGPHGQHRRASAPSPPCVARGYVLMLGNVARLCSVDAHHERADTAGDSTDHQERADTAGAARPVVRDHPTTMPASAPTDLGEIEVARKRPAVASCSSRAERSAAAQGNLWWATETDRCDLASPGSPGCQRVPPIPAAPPPIPRRVCAGILKYRRN
jgi:hypothetical protein